jgi:hypothetical protein
MKGIDGYTGRLSRGGETKHELYTCGLCLSWKVALSAWSSQEQQCLRCPPGWTGPDGRCTVNLPSCCIRSTGPWLSQNQNWCALDSLELRFRRQLKDTARHKSKVRRKRFTVEYVIIVTGAWSAILPRRPVGQHGRWTSEGPPIC